MEFYLKQILALTDNSSHNILIIFERLLTNLLYYRINAESRDFEYPVAFLNPNDVFNTRISKDLRHKLDNTMQINQNGRLVGWSVGLLVGINQTKAHVNNLWQICNFMRRNKLIEMNILSLFIIFSLKLYLNKHGTWPFFFFFFFCWNDFNNKLTYIFDNLN